MGFGKQPIEKSWVKSYPSKGKKEHDKRATIKEREWYRDKSRILKGG